MKNDAEEKTPFLNPSGDGCPLVSDMQRQIRELELERDALKNHIRHLQEISAAKKEVL